MLDSCLVWAYLFTYSATSAVQLHLEYLTLNQRVLSEPASWLESGAMDSPIVRPFYHRKMGLPAQRPCSCHAAKSKRHDTPYNVMPNRPMLQRKTPGRLFCSILLPPRRIHYFGGFFDSRPRRFLSPSPPILSLGSPINGSRCCRLCSSSIPASSPVSVRVNGILPNGLLVDRICPLPVLDDRSPGINDASGSVRFCSLPFPISDESPLGCVGMKLGDRDPTGEWFPCPPLTG